jgi:hypothetical protein
MGVLESGHRGETEEEFKLLRVVKLFGKLFKLFTVFMLLEDWG